MATGQAAVFGNAASPAMSPSDANTTAQTSKEPVQSSETRSPQLKSLSSSGLDSTESLDDASDALTPKASSHNRPTSREPSPLRPQFRVPGRTATRSRNDNQELSPIRNAVSGTSQPVPSAAAVQRARSANQPTLQSSVIDGSADPRPQKVKEPPRWPNSPRLTSPPPSASRILTTHRKQDGDMAAPNSSQKRTAAAVSDTLAAGPKSPLEKDEHSVPRAGMKAPARGASGAVSVKLETVAENSIPDTPSVIAPSEQSITSSPRESPRLPKDDGSEIAVSKSGRGSGDSESDNGVAKARLDGTGPSVPAQGGRTGILAKKPSANPSSLKGKGSEPLNRSMTVETETVSSVPQSSLNVPGDRGASGKLDASGSVRMKPSNEMMRKKEKKKSSRRPASINTGTVSSKADIFEAKVATAVDEANSSDSDETFVYESNPPEAYVPPRSARHHSRTPSANSVVSQIDAYGGRSKSVSKEGQHNIAGKRSMKFANYNTNFDGDYGTANASRGGLRTVTTPRHHHISRHSRGPSHTGLFDTDSPFTQANKTLTPRASNGRMSPNSPRYVGNRASPSPRKLEAYAYDADGGVADDEGMPLMGSVRINRSRHAKRPNGGSLRQLEYRDEDRRSYISRHGLCIVIAILFLILCLGAGTFILALSRPLVEVVIKSIDNVLASEQELVFDLNVKATNPNVFTIVVAELNVDIFAKSSFAGTSMGWQAHESNQAPPRLDDSKKREVLASKNRPRWFDWFHSADGVDKGTDPIDDPEQDTQTMVLGRIYDFDSPITFEPSPLFRSSSISQGEIRLTTPGNTTEVGGSARWERVIQHPFELIVRGALKYQLPLSSKPRSVSVRAKVAVDPKGSEGAKPKLLMLEDDEDEG